MLDNLEKAVKKISSFLVDLSKTVMMIQHVLNHHALFPSPFLVSKMFRGKKDFLTKIKAVFDISTADANCKNYGGYLVELDDQEEMNFVGSFVTRAGGWGSYVFTGANDLKEENRFVQYRSKKPLLSAIWASGEPNNARKREDCVEIMAPSEENIRHRLNDVECDLVSRYVCESQ
ncbi:collectin-11 [Plakobranchus ocellatus]|uniref:Collectin-11 n=1 Tax=Plakobranchus ocellatus TaxID=259542 RepID=A0AAV4B6T4_9GAST|nr:collectin-11 [Plakobranchus ocellatus]